MREEDVDTVAHVFGQEYSKSTAIAAHDLSKASIESVFDENAESVTCPACSTVFNPMIRTCPECELQFG